MNIKKIEKILRTIPTEQKILNHEKRVSVIKGSDIYNLLSQQNLSASQINELMEHLMVENVLIKALVKEKNCSISLHKKFKKEDSYIWLKEEGNTMRLFIALLCILGAFALVMHQMWPKNVRHYFGYVFYILIAFLVFMMVLGVIRLILFCITFFSHPPGIWLFPNLFADVGFIESFIPVWSYHGEDVKPKKED